MWMDRERRGKETLEELQRTFQRKHGHQLYINMFYVYKIILETYK